MTMHYDVYSLQIPLCSNLKSVRLIEDKVMTYHMQQSDVTFQLYKTTIQYCI